MFISSLSNIAFLSDAESRSINAENPTGEKGGGAKAIPAPGEPGGMLGEGWKVRPFIPLPANSTVTLAEIDGPGLIQQIWITSDPIAMRTCILRFYWDHEETPSIETPFGDFFCHGQGEKHNVVSMPIVVNPSSGFNSYWPMPFRKHCRITMENTWVSPIGSVYYQINYSLQEVPDDAAYLHAQWRRSVTPMDNPEHVILEGVKGQGHYVGTFLSWMSLSAGWWGEGEIKFFMDGDGQYPTICGTGTEDYFGGAWGFYGKDNKEETYNTPFLGMPMARRSESKPAAFELYRWHIMDPIRFKQELKVTMQALGWWQEGHFQPLRDDISSLALWYQSEPHGAFPVLPSKEMIWVR